MSDWEVTFSHVVHADSGRDVAYVAEVVDAASPEKALQMALNTLSLRLKSGSAVEVKALDAQAEAVRQHEMRQVWSR